MESKLLKKHVLDKIKHMIQTNKDHYKDETIKIKTYENEFKFEIKMKIDNQTLIITILKLKRKHNYLYKYNIQFLSHTIYYYGYSYINLTHPDLFSMIKNLFKLLMLKSKNSQETKIYQMLYSTPLHYRSILKKQIIWINSLEKRFLNYIIEYTESPKYQTIMEILLYLIKYHNPPPLARGIHVHRCFTRRTFSSGIIQEALSSSLELKSNESYGKSYSSSSKRIYLKKGTFVFPILNLSSVPHEFELLIQPYTYININNPTVVLENAIDIPHFRNSNINQIFIKNKFIEMTKEGYDQYNYETPFCRFELSSKLKEKKRAKTSSKKSSSSSSKIKSV